MHLEVEQYSMCMKSFIIFKHLSSISFLTIIILSSSPPQTNACVAQHLLMRHFWQTAEVESYLKELLSSPDWPVVESAIQVNTISLTIVPSRIRLRKRHTGCFFTGTLLKSYSMENLGESTLT